MPAAWDGVLPGHQGPGAITPVCTRFVCLHSALPLVALEQKPQEASHRPRGCDSAQPSFSSAGASHRAPKAGAAEQACLHALARACLRTPQAPASGRRAWPLGMQELSFLWQASNSDIASSPPSPYCVTSLFPSPAPVAQPGTEQLSCWPAAL